MLITRGQVCRESRVRKFDVLVLLGFGFTALALSSAFAQAPATPTSIPASAMLDRLMQMDTNHDGAISEVELQAGREAVFARLDADHDGFITPDEVPQLGGRLGPLAQADSDHDGKLSHAEYVGQPSQVAARLDVQSRWKHLR